MPSIPDEYRGVAPYLNGRNAAAGYGPWPDGLSLLRRLEAACAERPDADPRT